MGAKADTSVTEFGFAGWLHTRAVANHTTPSMAFPGLSATFRAEGVHLFIDATENCERAVSSEPKFSQAILEETAPLRKQATMAAAAEFTSAPRLLARLQGFAAQSVSEQPHTADSRGRFPANSAGDLMPDP